jgi:hypothetical protein
MFGYLSRCSEEEILRAACALRRSAGEPVSNLLRILYPDKWEDLNDIANREKVLKAMQRWTEIVLPKTYD